MLKGILLIGIEAYQRIGPFLFLKTCRFTPTCSAYAREAIIKKGPFKGLWLSIIRILKCHPFSKPGYDPVR